MNRIKIKLANFLLKNLFNAVTEDDILRYYKSKYHIAGNEVPKSDLQDISSGAKAMQGILAWQLLIKEMKWEANKAIYQKSQTIDDIIFGKAMLATIEIMEHKLNEMSLIN